MTRAAPISLCALLLSTAAPNPATPQEASAPPTPAAADEAAEAEPERELFVVAGRSVDGLADAHRGLTEHLRETLTRTGVLTRNGRSSRLATCVSLTT